MRRGIRTVILCLGLFLALGLVSGGWLGARASVSRAGRSPHPFPPRSARLYRLPTDPRALQPLGLHSLADLPGPMLRTGISSWAQNPAIIATADGSRFAVLDQAPHPHWPLRGRDMTLQLFDARTGRPLSARHHPAVPVSISGISADGSVVYGFDAGSASTMPCGPNLFYLLDTRTGKLLRRLTLAGPPYDPGALVGPNVGRLYTMTIPDHINYCGPEWAYSPTITAYDLHTGKAVRAVRLSGVLAGTWNTSRTINNEPIGESWDPGFALSPDGSQLAIFDEHDEAVTLLRASTLAVMRTEHLTRPQSPLEAISAMLGLAPETAEAKGEIDGAFVQTQYTPDGRSLLLTGSRLHPDKRHLYSSAQSLGVQLIDVASGQIRAQFPGTAPVTGLWVAPDGSAVYSAIQGWRRRGGWLTTLRRHDPATLRVQTRRTFTHTTWLNLFFLQ